MQEKSRKMPHSFRRPEGSLMVTSGKARPRAPEGCGNLREVTKGVCHALTGMVQAAIPMQALVKQGGLHGGGDLGSEPEKLRRRSAGGGQSRGFPVWEPWKRIAFWSPGDRSQWLQPRRRKEGGEVEGLIIKGALSLPPTEPQPPQPPHTSRRELGRASQPGLLMCYLLPLLTTCPGQRSM